MNSPIEVFPKTKSIDGSNQIKFRVLAESSRMQIDLQTPLKIESVSHNQQTLKFTREGNVYWIDFPQPLPVGSTEIIEIKYSGEPVRSRLIRLGRAGSSGRKTTKATPSLLRPAKDLEPVFGGRAKITA